MVKQSAFESFQGGTRKRLLARTRMHMMMKCTRIDTRGARPQTHNTNTESKTKTNTNTYINTSTSNINPSAILAQRPCSVGEYESSSMGRLGLARLVGLASSLAGRRGRRLAGVEACPPQAPLAGRLGWRPPGRMRVGTVLARAHGVLHP